MAPVVYTAVGDRIGKQLYEETLDEFSFAGARDIVDIISGSK